MSSDSQIPTDLHYTEDHTWILLEEDNGTIGLTDYGQSELSEIVYVELPDVGTEVVQGSPFGSIEAMKTVAELISPASGEVLEINENVEDDPRLINTDPYGEGWMIKIKIYEPEEIENILTPQDYILMLPGEDV